MSEQCPFCVEARTEAAKQYYRQISEFEEAHPVDYPRYLRTIQEIIERRCKST